VKAHYIQGKLIICYYYRRVINLLLVNSIMVGTIAIPSIIKMSQVMKSNRTEWTQQDELPVSEIQSNKLVYSSSF
jgi:hypothetical protein